MTDPKTRSDVAFRRERPAEARAVHDVVAEAFGDQLVARLVEALRTSDAWIEDMSFVAVRDGVVVGHILFTRSVLDTPTRLVDVLVLSPVSVAPAVQGQGIGSGLIRYGLEQVRATTWPLVFLEGSPLYYPRFGFEPAGDLGFRRPSLRIPLPAFMCVRLPAYAPWMTGTLVYSHVFWDLDSVGLRDPDA